MEIAQRLTSTRGGTLAVAALAAVLAGGSILVYLNGYRHSIKAEGAPVTVLVANTIIHKGTPGSAVAVKGLFRPATVRESQLRNGAFSDPASLRGQIATTDIVKGQQLTTAEFSGGVNSVASTLTGAERVISVPLDSAHGLIGGVQKGDHVDIFAGFNVTLNGVSSTRPMLRLIAQDVPVVSVGGPNGSLGNNATTLVSLKVHPRQAAELAFTSDNGKLWLVVRPPNGAKPSRPGLVTISTVLLGVPPLNLSTAGTYRKTQQDYLRALGVTP
ncbi:MAG TPA: Flp pilus assembly protein CpaB [Gaiellaceae bacterium]|nr:Flp pilus assembly protein CpaB [Gaiellaceae bacterium]